MTNKLFRAGSSYTTPEVPYQPGRPAYTTSQTYEVVLTSPPTGNGLAPGWVYQKVPYSLPDGTVGYRMEPRWTGSGVGGGPTPISGQGTYTTYYTVTTNHPAIAPVPGSPSKRVDIPPVGWTASARSIESIGVAGVATFKAPKDVAGAAVGFSYVNSPQPRRPGYSDLHKGLFFSSGQVKLLLDGTALGAYVDSDTFKIDMKRNGDTRWYRNNDLIYSAVEEAVPPGQIGNVGGDNLARSNLVAVLYASGDFVDAPTLSEGFEGYSTAIAPAMTSFSGNIEGGTSIARAPAMTADSRSDLMSFAGAPASRAYSSNLAGGTSTARAPAARADSYGDTLEVIVPSNSIAQSPSQTAASLGLVHLLGHNTATTPSARALSFQEPGGQSIARPPAARALSYNEDSSVVLVVAGMALEIDISTRRTSRVEIHETLGLNIDLDTQRVEEVRILESLGLNIGITPSSISTVRIGLSMALDLAVSVPGADLEVWAVNVEGFGSTSYSNFPFGSFARIGDRYYGAKGDGLFQLGGDTDSGAEIRAAFAPGNLDFGTPQKKTVIEAWLGASSALPMTCSLGAAEEVYVYTADSFSPSELERHRIKFGRGLRASYIRPVFYNTGGGDFEVDALEFEVATLLRKK